LEDKQEEFQRIVGTIQETQVQLGTKHQQLEGQHEAISGKLEIVSEQRGDRGESAASGSVDLQSLREEITAVKAKMQDSEARLESQRQSSDDIHEKVDGLHAKLDVHDHNKVCNELDSLKERIEKAERQATAVPGLGEQAPGDVADRLKSIECRLEQHSAGSTTAEDDVQARTDVQAQLQELTTQVLAELSDLSCHQKGLEETKVTMKQIADQVSALEGRLINGDANICTKGSTTNLSSDETVESRVESLSRQVLDLTNRMHQAEHSMEHMNEGSLNFTQTMDAGTMDYSATGNTFEIPRGGPVGLARAEIKAAEHAELSSSSLASPAVTPVGSPATGAACRKEKVSRSQGSSPAGSDSSTSKRRSPATSPAGSGKGLLAPLEHKRADLPSLSGGSLSKLGDLPSLGAKSKRSSGARLGAGPGGDVLDSLLGSGGSSGDGLEGAMCGGSSGSTKPDSSTSEKPSDRGGRQRPSPLNLEQEGDSEEKGGRLTRIAEEESRDGPDNSDSKEPATKAVRNRSPADKQSPGALDSPVGVGEVSASALEFSVGVDFSVEDSLELEKCDVVEVVIPQRKEIVPVGCSASEAGVSPPGSPQGTPHSRRSLVADGKDGSPANSSGQLGAPGNNDSGPIVGIGLGGASSPGCSLRSGEVERSLNKSKEQYGNESFEDENDMSVAESIDESMASDCQSESGGV